MVDFPEVSCSMKNEIRLEGKHEKTDKFSVIKDLCWLARNGNWEGGEKKNGPKRINYFYFSHKVEEEVHSNRILES